MDYNKRRMLAINPIYGPDYLSCKWLSEDIKNQFKNRLDGFDQELLRIEVSDEVISEIMLSVKAIYTFSITDTEQIDKYETYKRFQEYNKTLDNLRSEKLENVIEMDFNPLWVNKII